MEVFGPQIWQHNKIDTAIFHNNKIQNNTCIIRDHVCSSCWIKSSFCLVETLLHELWCVLHLLSPMEAKTKLGQTKTGAIIDGRKKGLSSRAMYSESNGIVATPAATALVSTTMLDRRPLSPRVNPLLWVYLLVSSSLIVMNLFQIFSRGHSHQR